MAGNTAYAEYDFFAVASESAKYKLSLGTYVGKYFIKRREPMQTSAVQRVNVGKPKVLT